MKSQIRAALKKYFGFSEFKGLQETVIESILSKNNTFVIMPTGGGKSLCYQLPALMQEGTAIVVSPLIALMKNQVDAIRGISDQHGVAHVLNSSLNKTEIKRNPQLKQENVMENMRKKMEAKENYLSYSFEGSRQEKRNSSHLLLYFIFRNKKGKIVGN